MAAEGSQQPGLYGEALAEEVAAAMIWGKEDCREPRGGVGSRPHPFLGMVTMEFKVPLGHLLNYSADKEVEI